MGFLTVPAGIVQQASTPPSESLDLTGLLAWYRLNEASGNALDAHTTMRNLTQNGTVGSAAGIVGTSRTGFGGSNNFFQTSDTALRFTNTTFYVSGWAFFTAAGAMRFMGSWAGFTSSARWALLKEDVGEKIRLFFRTTTDSNTILDSTAAVTLNQWIFIETYYNSAISEVGVALNRGAFTMTTISGSPSTSGTPANYQMGTDAGNSDNPMVGRLDEWTFWNTLPTEDRRDYLWNDGAGNTYPV